MFRFAKGLVALSITVGLLGCAADSTSTQSPLAKLNTDFEKTGQNTIQKLKTYSNGTTVLLALKGSVGSAGKVDDPEYYFAITSDEVTLTETFNGLIEYELTGYNDFGGNKRYAQSTEGINSSGKVITSTTYGNTLDTSGAYASISVGTVGEERTLFSAGSVTTSLPTGQFTYSGGDTYIVFDTYQEQSNGNITLTADFTNKTGSVLAKTDNTYMSATNFDINLIDGTFSGDSAEIGLIGGLSKVASTINGAFAGSGATGVHGMVSSIDSSSQGQAKAVGVFNAVKD